MLIGWLVNRGLTKPFVAPKGLIVLGILGLIASVVYWPYWPNGREPSERFLIWGLPAAFIVAGSTFSEISKGTKKIQTIVLFGNASYAIYVTHYIVLGAVFKVIRLVGQRSAFPVTLPVALLVSFLICLIVGVLFHIVVERPVVAFLSGPRLLGRPESSGG
jgi:exopolysaccharide production protein ExoZ